MHRHVIAFVTPNLILRAVRVIELRRGRRSRCDRLAAMTYNNLVLVPMTAWPSPAVWGVQPSVRPCATASGETVATLVPVPRRPREPTRCPDRIRRFPLLRIRIPRQLTRPHSLPQRGLRQVLSAVRRRRVKRRGGGGPAARSPECAAERAATLRGRGMISWLLSASRNLKGGHGEAAVDRQRLLIAKPGAYLLARRAAPQPTIKSTLARQIDEFVAVFAVAREMIPERDMIRPQKVDIETIDVAGRR